jgi:hypothetical protein
MGSSYSYQKANESANIFDNDIDNLNNFLSYSFPTNSTAVSTIDDDPDFFKNIRDKVLEDIVDHEPDENDKCPVESEKEKAEKLFNNLEKIKRSIDLIMLYDNYNINNDVIIKDLSKKYNNQMLEIKKRTESTDLINHELNVIKNKINKNNKIDKTLLIFIIIFVLLIIIVGLLTALKFVKL